MWDWLSNNSEVVSLLVNVGLLLVWLSYLQLFLYGFKRRRRCKILVNIGGGTRLSSRCLVCNMSEEPVYVLSIVATVTTAQGSRRGTVTDYEMEDEAQPTEAGQVTRQGPLRQGDCRDIGSMGQLVESARHTYGDWESPDKLDHDRWPREVKLTVVAIYGPEDLPVAAERSFKLTREDGQQVTPITIDTQQIRGRRARKRLYDHLSEYV